MPKFSAFCSRTSDSNLCVPTPVWFRNSADKRVYELLLSERHRCLASETSDEQPVEPDSKMAWKSNLTEFQSQSAKCSRRVRFVSTQLKITQEWNPEKKAVVTKNCSRWLLSCTEAKASSINRHIAGRSWASCCLIVIELFFIFLLNASASDSNDTEEIKFLFWSNERQKSSWFWGFLGQNWT